MDGALTVLSKSHCQIHCHLGFSHVNFRNFIVLHYILRLMVSSSFFVKDIRSVSSFFFFFFASECSVVQVPFVEKTLLHCTASAICQRSANSISRGLFMGWLFCSNDQFFCQNDFILTHCIFIATLEFEQCQSTNFVLL